MSTHTHVHTLLLLLCVLQLQLQPPRTAALPCLLVRLIRSHVGEQHFNFGFRFVLPTMSQRSRVSGFRAQHARPGNAPSSASSAAAAHSPQRGSNARRGSGLAWSGPARLVAVNHKRAHNSSIKLDATKSTVSWTPIHLPLLHPLSALPPSGHALEAATLSVHRRMTCGPPLPPATQFQHPSRRAH